MLSLDHFMGARPHHFPLTKARIQYDAEAIYVAFDVEDQYVCARARKNQDAVCKDSCVEFFFSPGTNTTRGYFNLEMSCTGVMLFHFQRVPRKHAVEIAETDLEAIEIEHSLPNIIEEEIEQPTPWSIRCRLPLRILNTYCGSVTPPTRGAEWRGNVYKCADASSHPHWLTWSPVDRPQPDFHCPDSFGVLRFT